MYHSSTKNQNSPNKKNRFKVRAIIGFAILMLLFLVTVLNFNMVYVYYRYLFKTDNFRDNQSVFAPKRLFDGNVDQFSVSRMIRPLTTVEVNDMFFLSTEKKNAFLKMAKHASLKPYVREFDMGFDLNIMKANKSATVGTYINTFILPTKTLDGQTVLSVYYAIKPDKKVFYNDFSKYDMPDYYTFADSIIYIPTISASNHSPVNQP